MIQNHQMCVSPMVDSENVKIWFCSTDVFLKNSDLLANKTSMLFHVGVKPEIMLECDLPGIK